MGQTAERPIEKSPPGKAKTKEELEKKAKKEEEAAKRAAAEEEKRRAKEEAERLVSEGRGRGSSEGG